MVNDAVNRMNCAFLDLKKVVFDGCWRPWNYEDIDEEHRDNIIKQFEKLEKSIMNITGEHSFFNLKQFLQIEMLNIQTLHESTLRIQQEMNKKLSALEELKHINRSIKKNLKHFRVMDLKYIEKQSKESENVCICI